MVESHPRGATPDDGRDRAGGLAQVPPSLQRLCDDSSVFGPGATPVEEALDRHVRHSLSDYRQFIGPLVVGPEHLDGLGRAAGTLPARSVWTALRVDSPADLGDAVLRLGEIDSVRLAGAEIGMPPGFDPAAVVPTVLAGLGMAGIDETEMYVDVPEDERREAVLSALSGSDLDARIRVGGAGPIVPEAGLAGAMLDTVTRHLPFQAAGELHRAVRGTDPDGSDRHGILNVLLAADAARQAVGRQDDTGILDQLVAILADRDASAIAAAFHALSTERALAARSSVTSFDARSVMTPFADLAGLGLVVRA